MKIACTVGHSILKNGNITSASGVVNEYKWCKQFVPILVEAFNHQEGYNAVTIQCPEKEFTEAKQEKTYKLGKINGKGYDLVIESHLNAHNGNAKGTEVLYYTNSTKSKPYAQRVNDKLDDVFTDRGIKPRSDLYILRDTDCPAILIEYFFCDNKEDYTKADTVEEMRDLALKVVEGVMNKTPKNPWTKTTTSTPTSTDKTTYYRVVAGSYTNRQNADKLVSELKSKGYNAFIDIYSK